MEYTFDSQFAMADVVFDPDDRNPDIAGELRRWGSITVGTPFKGQNGWCPPLTKLLNDAAFEINRLAAEINRLQLHYDRATRVADTGGVADRSEFHRGWSGCCEMLKAALNRKGSGMTEPNSPREAVEQHRATQSEAKELEAVTSKSRFKVGDVVVLRSGGPKMTVFMSTEVIDRLVETEWFAGDELRRDSFSAVELEHAPPRETP